MRAHVVSMHTAHVLLVDDRENIRFTFRLALKSEGYEVATAARFSSTPSAASPAALPAGHTPPFLIPSPEAIHA